MGIWITADSSYGLVPSSNKKGSISVLPTETVRANVQEVVTVRTGADQVVNPNLIKNRKSNPKPNRKIRVEGTANVLVKKEEVDLVILNTLLNTIKAT